MSSAALRTITLLGGLGLALWSPAGLAAGIDAVAEYAVTMGGTHVATVEVRLADDGARYSMNLDARISGLARLVASGFARAESAGTSGPRALRSQKFDLLTRADGQDFTVAVTYAGDNVASFVVNPPIINNIDRVAIERKHLTTANDMLAPFVLKGGKLDASLCDRKMQIFTGVERFNLSLSFVKNDVATSKRTGYQGPVVLCSVHYAPVSGHYTSSEITSYLAANERILLWYAPLGATGSYIPYRALANTEAGDLSVVLTDLRQQSPVR